MKKTVSIKKNFEYKRVYHRGRSVVGPYIAVYVLNNKGTQNRLGLTVSKKIGNAVERNRAKRLMRESYRLIEDEVLPGFDIVLVARQKCINSNCNQVKASLISAFKTLGVLNKGDMNEKNIDRPN